MEPTITQEKNEKTWTIIVGKEVTWNYFSYYKCDFNCDHNLEKLNDLVKEVHYGFFSVAHANVCAYAYAGIFYRSHATQSPSRTTGPLSSIRFRY